MSCLPSMRPAKRQFHSGQRRSSDCPSSDNLVQADVRADWNAGHNFRSGFTGASSAYSGIVASSGRSVTDGVLTVVSPTQVQYKIPSDAVTGELFVGNPSHKATATRISRCLQRVLRLGPSPTPTPTRRRLHSTPRRFHGGSALRPGFSFTAAPTLSGIRWCRTATA